MKKIEVVISERFYVRGEKIFQHFIYEKKYDKYIKNHTLSVYEQFEVKLNQKTLNLNFIKRREEPGKSILEYEFEGGTKPKNSYFTILSFIPDNYGCDFCTYKEEKVKPFVWCEFKQETLPHKIKRCKFFRQKR